MQYSQKNNFNFAINPYRFGAIAERFRPPQKYRTFVRYFLYGIGASHDFIVVLLCNMNSCGLITNEERRKRVAFANIECSLIANKSDTKCPRKAQCNARFVERRRSEKLTSSLSSLLQKRPRHASYERNRSFTYKISLMIDDRFFIHHPEKMMFS